jgi:hypothetical protein
MPIKIPPQSVINLQMIEAGVSGPDGANRLFTITGMADCGVSANAPGPNNSATQQQTFSVLVGPQLTRRQFISAIGVASLSRFHFFNNPASSNFSVNAVDADWDDESGQVELRVEIEVFVAGASGSGVQISRFGFQVTILAEFAAA